MELLLLLKFDNSSSSVTRDKEIWSFLLTLDMSQLFYQVWVRPAAKNDLNTLHLEKIQELRAKDLA